MDDLTCVAALRNEGRSIEQIARGLNQSVHATRKLVASCEAVGLIAEHRMTANLEPGWRYTRKTRLWPLNPDTLAEFDEQ